MKIWIFTKDNKSFEFDNVISCDHIMEENKLRLHRDGFNIEELNLNNVEQIKYLGGN